MSTFCHRCNREQCHCGLMIEQSPAQSLHDQAQAAIADLELMRVIREQSAWIERELAKKRVEVAELKANIATLRNPNAGVRQAYPGGRWT